MLKRSMAANLIGRLSEHLEYNINIMDESGIIIASRDTSRINSFHEAAYNIIQGDEEIEIIYEDDQLIPGVKPGVNLPILNNHRKIGVVGVTGNPEEIKGLAYAVKTAVEVLLEYELYKEKIIRRQDKKNLLLNTLLYEENTNVQELRSLSVKLGYNDNIIRIPIIFKFHSKIAINDVLSVMKTNILHTDQDMSFITTERDILIFKALDQLSNMLLESIKIMVNEFIEKVEAVLDQNSVCSSFSCFVGSFQINLKLYREAYQHTQWLINYIYKYDRKIFYFYDYIYEYFQSRITKNDYYNIFSVFDKFMDQSLEKKLIETTEALLKSNMSIKKTAEKLGVHRNTVYFRLENIKDLLGIDPLIETTDSFLLFSFSEYCKFR